MTIKKTLWLSMATTLSFADAQLDQLRAELAAQKKHMQILEKKIEMLAQKQQQQVLHAQAPNTSASFSQNAYLPDIAFILNMAAVGRNVANESYENFAIPGFIDSGDAELPFDKKRGFNFNYAEVAMRSTVDPYFNAFAIFHLHPDEFEIEEAYVRTRALPYGLRVEAGKFRSAFGRINAKHQHSWYFDQQPIIYKALFGPEGIGGAGVQLQWVAPTETYLMAGIEGFEEGNDRSFGNSDHRNIVGYLKTSVDPTEDLSLLGGLSLAHGRHDGKRCDVYGIDMTVRNQFEGYSALIWQSEYLERHKQRTTGGKDRQAGFYTELVYQYDNHYAGGFRYDRITKNDTDLSAFTDIDTDRLDKYTAMIEYRPFPMSRLRLSYSWDRTKVIDGERKNLSEILFSLNIAAGAHGAHNY